MGKRGRKRVGAALAALMLQFALAAAGGEGGWSDAPDLGGGERRLEDLYFSPESVELDERDRRALGLIQAWRRGEVLAESPAAGPDGAVEFLYGAERPSIVCAVLQLTDIELQAGEAVTGVNLGDSVRWQVQPAVSGGNVPHLLVRPREVGLDTSMVVATDRRTYHFRLRSHRSEYLPRVRFHYPEEALAKWAALGEGAARRREADTLPETREYLGDLDFGYRIEGKAPWKPVRVYSDGTRTVLEMPKSFRQGEAPALLALEKSGRLFRSSEPTLLNYRIQGRRYLVDAVLERAILVAGVGGGQTRVSITRLPAGRE
ncbi:MAG: P-type conjugative transfer protein TrbG [Planctomycetota bacterium]|nr:P-type conjugative transfer protein TrbG [Planctomycetota bacterium]